MSNELATHPKFIYEEGNTEPTAVILEIEEYKEMLERIEDAEALHSLNEMRKQPMSFRKFDDFVKALPGV